MRYEVFQDDRALGQRADDLFAQGLAGCQAEGRDFQVALSGGHTPVALYRELRERSLAWERVQVYFSDERCVPPDSPESNYRLAKEELLDHVPIPGSRVHRLEGELPPEEAARRYLALLPERFDLIYLGTGEDGHTASLFPGTQGLSARERVLANWVPKLESWRLSLSFGEINRAREVVLLATGGAKAQVVLAASQGEGDLPVLKLKDPLWLLDTQSAALLSSAAS